MKTGGVVLFLTKQSLS